MNFRIIELEKPRFTACQSNLTDRGIKQEKNCGISCGQIIVKIFRDKFARDVETSHKTIPMTVCGTASGKAATTQLRENKQIRKILLSKNTSYRLEHMQPSRQSVDGLRGRNFLNSEN